MPIGGKIQKWFLSPQEWAGFEVRWMHFKMNHRLNQDPSRHRNTEIDMWAKLKLEFSLHL